MSDTTMQRPDHNELASSGWTVKDSNLGSKEPPSAWPSPSPSQSHIHLHNYEHLVPSISVVFASCYYFKNRRSLISTKFLQHGSRIVVR
jgi:hypothetical protein